MMSSEIFRQMELATRIKRPPEKPMKRNPGGPKKEKPPKKKK